MSSFNIEFVNNRGGGVDCVIHIDGKRQLVGWAKKNKDGKGGYTVITMSSSLAGNELPDSVRQMASRFDWFNKDGTGLSLKDAKQNLTIVAGMFVMRAAIREGK